MILSLFNSAVGVRLLLSSQGGTADQDRTTTVNEEQETSLVCAVSTMNLGLQEEETTSGSKPVSQEQEGYSEHGFTKTTRFMTGQRPGDVFPISAK